MKILQNRGKNIKNRILYRMIGMCLLIACGSLFFPVIRSYATNATGGKQVVRVGYADTSAFLYQDKDGKYAGAAYEYLRALAMYNGWEYEFISGTEEEGTDRIKKGEVDLYLPMRKTEQVDGDLLYSKEAFCDSQVVLVTNASKTIGYEEYEKLNEMVIGCYAEKEDQKKLEEILKKNNCKVTFRNYPDGKSLAEDLSNGKIDAALDKNSREVQNYKVVSRLGLKNEYVVCKKEHAELMQEFESAKKQVENENPYLFAQLDEKYQRQTGNSILSFTKEEEQFISENRTVNVVLGPGDYNKKYTSKKNGSDALLEQMSQISGLHFKVIRAESLDVMFEKIQNGQGDVVLAMNNDYQWADEKNLWLTQSYFTQQTYEVRKSTMSREAVKTIAVTKGSYLEEQLKEKKQFVMIECESNEEAFEKVYQGEADALVCAQLVGDYFSTKSKYSKLDYDILEGQLNEYCLGVSKKCDSKFISIFNKTIAAIPKEEVHQMFSIAGMEQKVTLEDYFYANPFKVMLIAVAVVTLVLLFLAAMVILVVMKKKNQQLVKANRAKKDFLSHMSHEMKTPLNGIRGCLELTQNCTEEERKEYIQKALVSAQHLDGLIGNVLDMAKIESGKIELLKSWVGVEQLINEISMVIQEQAQKKHILYSCEVDEMQYYEIWADKGRLYQAVLNLLINAVRYTQEGGKVVLRVDAEKLDATHVRITFHVMDNGIGMSPEFVQVAMEPFSQQSKEESLRGSGLGLAITREIAKLAGGELKIESQEGIGTKAEIVFPTEIRLREEMLENLVPERKKDYTENDLEKLKGKRALVVEDNDINAFVARKYLQEINIVTELAENGKEALEKFKNSELHYYDMIFMDLMMPVMDGLEATKEIRKLQREDAKNIPIIAMTASEFAVDRQTFEDCRLDYQLKKPYGKKELWNAIVFCQNHHKTGIL